MENNTTQFDLDSPKGNYTKMTTTVQQALAREFIKALERRDTDTMITIRNKYGALLDNK